MTGTRQALARSGCLMRDSTTLTCRSLILRRCSSASSRAINSLVSQLSGVPRPKCDKHAEAFGVTRKTLSAILSQRAGISPEMAIQLRQIHRLRDTRCSWSHESVMIELVVRLSSSCALFTGEASSGQSSKIKCNEIRNFSHNSCSPA